MEATNKLALVVKDAGLSQIQADYFVGQFYPYFESAQKLGEEAAAINVTDATQVTEIRKAKDLRVRIKKIRTNAEAMRKELKDESLRTGKTIDKLNAVIVMATEPVEARLEEMEKIAERAEAARKAAAKTARESMLAPYAPGGNATIYRVEEMTENEWGQFYEGMKQSHEARVAAAAKAEEDRKAAEVARKAAEVARKAEEARLAAENARLKAEQEANEKQARIERERVAAEQKAAADKAATELAAANAKAQAEKDAIEAKARAEREAAEKAARIEREAAAEVLRKEREAREKLEAENKAKADAEAARVAAEARAAKKAAMAPDKDKLLALAEQVRTLPMPVCKSEAAQAMVARVLASLTAFANKIVTEADAL